MKDASKVIRHHDKLIRALAQSVCRVDVDDLVQEGRIAMLEALKSYDESRGIQFWTYARKFVLGAMFAFLKREAKEVRASMDDSTDAPDEAPNAEEAMIGIEDRAEKTRRVAAAFATLTPEEKELVTKHFAGVSNRSIATEQDSSKDTVRRALNGAVETLRQRVA